MVLVVIFSVAVQATSLPALASALRVPMRTVRPEPWAFGVRLRNQPDDAHRLTVAAGSAADGRTVGQLLTLPQTAWISFLVRNGTLLPVSPDTELRAGDQVLVLAESGSGRGARRAVRPRLISWPTPASAGAGSPVRAARPAAVEQRHAGGAEDRRDHQHRRPVRRAARAPRPAARRR